METPQLDLMRSVKECLDSLAKHTSIPREFLFGLPASDDWSLIIKLHSLIELALNLLVTKAIGDDRISAIIKRLDTSDSTKGKLAFVKAFELLPKEARTFVRTFSELRNDLVHDLNNFNFSIPKWIAEMSPQELVNFITSLNFGMEGKREHWFSKRQDIFKKLSHDDLKAIIILACLTILHIAIDLEFKTLIEPLERELARLDGLTTTWEAGVKHGKEKKI